MEEPAIGEAVSEADIERALQSDCECRDGMFPQGKVSTASRRAFLRGTGFVTAAAAIVPVRAMAADDGDAPWSLPGAIAKSDYGSRAGTEKVMRLASQGGTSALTPLQAGVGIITPSGLHFERHHNGIPTIDPKEHRLIIHGMVDKPMKYSVEDLKRFPSISRIIFIECSGNSNAASRSAGQKTAQEAHGLTSTSEWTGVRLSTLLAQVGVKDGAAWVLAEGSDGAMLSRSVPIDKMLDDAFVAYAQNGEAIRPENGYPMRLILPGWEGNINVKWLRRLKIGDKPFMTREETSKYTDLMTNTGKARQFSWVMEAKSLITFPSGDMRLPGKGFYEISGIAWSGRAPIERVEITTDGGKSWSLASLQEPVLPKAHVRFRYPWHWDGSESIIESRATDQTGYVQPTKSFLTRTEGVGPTYHYNGIQSWKVATDGSVSNVLNG
ncbi:MAG TPA: sulfite dehydrogenase [Rhizomicrobium sp.]|jgi:sulfane dehydrogenase subunit SoxC|nr:sulfite dehydrogenase [Rhizomicrobium sp.]